MSINALFEELTCPLTIQIEGEGEVSEQIVNAKTDYAEGTTVELTAEPAEGWQFVGWLGDLNGSENPATITMNKAKTITAEFESKTYSLTVNIEGEGEVSEEIVNNKKADYPQNTIVELTAEPKNEWHFVEWTGDLASNENPVTVTMDQNKNINAVFGFGFYEDFDDGEAQNWLFSDNKFAIKDGELEYFIDKGIKYGSAYYNKKFKNFKVETKVSQISQKKESVVVVYIRSNGFLVQDEENEIFAEGYFMAISSNGVLIAKAEQNGDSVESEFFYEAEIDLSYGENNYHTLTINANGSNFDFYIDGNHIHSFSDDTFTEPGFVTIATVNIEEDRNCQTFWDYVKLSPPDMPFNL